MDSFNLKNLVIFPTHIHQHILYLILDDIDNPIVQWVTKAHLLSDHNFIHMTLAVSRPKPDKVCKCFKKLKQINHQELRDDIIHELAPDTTQLVELVQNYDRTLKTTMQQTCTSKAQNSQKEAWTILV